MPIRKVTSTSEHPAGFKWGSKGHTYPTRAGAERQAAAAHANGFQEHKSLDTTGDHLSQKPLATPEELLEALDTTSRTSKPPIMPKDIVQTSKTRASSSNGPMDRLRSQFHRSYPDRLDNALDKVVKDSDHIYSFLGKTAPNSQDAYRQSNNRIADTNRAANARVAAQRIHVGTGGASAPPPKPVVKSVNAIDPPQHSKTYHTIDDALCDAIVDLDYLENT